ncbi:MAG TPA: PilZ domain-containing protein [Nitrospiraceae bacterium]|nr:PilZ domain-containing protein [Nitrospiraceae bacterium]
MKELHCPACGTPFVRLTHQPGVMERLLNKMGVFTYRCQVCTNRFRAIRSGARHATQEFDQREYRRLTAQIPAALTVDQPTFDGIITDVSMGGCTIETDAMFPRGTFVEVLLKPPQTQMDIKVDAAMICSQRGAAVGLKFLEFEPDDKHRLGELVLSLLVTQTSPPGMTA